MDQVLARVLQLIQIGWVNHVTESDLLPYRQRREELTIQSGCIMWGLRVVIPPKLRKQVLEELHTAHSGMVQIKALARMHV
jgi:hypothetical protein